MMHRVPDCLFTTEDVDLVVENTGLSRAQIIHWAENFRSKVPLEKRVDVLMKKPETYEVCDLFCMY